MKGLTEIKSENQEAVHLFDDVLRKVTQLTTCAPDHIKEVFNGLVTAVIKHKDFNHDTEGVRVCGTLYKP